MENAKGGLRVSCWGSVDEFYKVKKLLFADDATVEGKKEALKILQTWKIRRAQDTPLGVLCTLILVDVHMKDLAGEIKDPSALSMIYGSAITKFINFASSFNSYRGSMYGTANNLGIDSFLIDLRHTCSHGKQTPSLEVFRQSHSICMNWIKNYYWSKEELNIADVDIKNIRQDVELERKLDNIFPFYDLLGDLIHKDIKNFEMLEASGEVSTARWPLVKAFMKEKNLTNFRHAFKFFTNQLSQIMELRSVRSNPEIFFRTLVTKCDYFMSAHQNAEKTTQNEMEVSDDEEISITPIKRQKKATHLSIVNLYQDLIWHIAKNDYLKTFLDTLFQINFNRSETQERRQSARFWILIILRSYHYYIQYCQFQKTSVAEQKKITEEIRNVYSYQLDADLKNVIIFVGTQMLPSSLRFSKEFMLNLLQNAIDDNDYDISVSLFPLVNPPLSMQQMESMKNLVDIKTSPNRKKNDASASKVFTLDDLHGNEINASASNIWKLPDTDVDWSSLPIGHEFKF